MTLDPALYDYLCSLVHTRAAIDLGDDKEYLVMARLEPVARREGLASVADLLRAVRSGAPGLVEDVVEAMTTKETSFFRNQAMWESLREHVLPEVIGARPRRLRLWSAAASTGQEAYSLAILLREHFSHLPNPEILATDLSRPALEQASAGRYSTLEVNRGLPARYLVKYFVQDGLSWTVRDELRQLVDFDHMNLATAWPALGRLDVVLLRNVLIYFDATAKAAVLGRVSKVLAPGGFLILGGAETTHGVDDRFERVPMGEYLCYRLRSGRMAP